MRITIFGSSHSEYIGVTADGIPAGIIVDTEHIAAALKKRASDPEISTPRRESDELIILSGVFNGKTGGDALTLALRNTDVRSSDYERVKNHPRASHADYTSFVHSGGFNDYRGGGQASGRMTALLVALGAVLADMLSLKGIRIATHIVQAGAEKFPRLRGRTAAEIAQSVARLQSGDFPALDDIVKEKTISAIKRARECGDSIGGVLETAAVGVPAGVGEPFFDSLESEIAHLAFAVPAVKGIEFGDGFDFAASSGSEVMDEFFLDEKGEIKTFANHNGGILGGMASGMPILLSTVVKPTPSVDRPMRTVDLNKMENTVLRLGGRHDSAIFHRAAIVMDSVVAIALSELMLRRYGRGCFSGEGRDE